MPDYLPKLCQVDASSPVSSFAGKGGDTLSYLTGAHNVTALSCTLYL